MPFVISTYNHFPITIPDASSGHDGLLTSALYDKLVSLPPSGTFTLAESYIEGGGNGGANNDLGDPTAGMVPAIGMRIAGTDGAAINVTNVADGALGSLGLVSGIAAFFAALGKSILVAAGNGHVGAGAGSNVIVRAGSAAGDPVAVGGNVVLTVGSGTGGGAAGQVQAAGVIIENQPAFGSPVIKSATVGGFMSYTADGVGGNYGGTGITPHQDAGTPNLSTIVLSVNDDASIVAAQGMFAAPLYATGKGTALAVTANTISPTQGIHHVGAGLIKTITKPPQPFFQTGSIVLIPDAAFTYDATGNIVVAAGSGTAVAGRAMTATWDGTKWYMSY